jgi:hypothetical protein
VITGFAGGRRRAGGGSIPKFATGGRVHGPSHAAGGIIAELEGGEYVVPKKFAKGGVLGITSSIGQIVADKSAKPAVQKSRSRTLSAGELKSRNPTLKRQLANVADKDTIEVGPTNVETFTLDKAFAGPTFIKNVAPKINDEVRRQVENAGLPPGRVSSIANDPKAKQSLEGFAFERFAGAILGITPGGDTSPFDFKTKSANLQKYTKNDPISEFLDAKRSQVTAASIVSKALNEPTVDFTLTKAGKNKRKSTRRRRAAGGIIQALATGDIVRANSVGAAILDPDDVRDGSTKVSVADVEAQLGFNKGTKKGFSGVGKVFSGKNYNIIRQGLNKKTSDRFNKVLAEGLIKGVDFAASELSNDLGLGPTTIDQGSKTKFIQSQRSAIRGDLFEAALSSLNNRGKFDNAVDFARPFDFPDGLQGPFADNFSKLPSKFVDAKSSEEAAPDANFRSKIIREIAADVVKQDPNILEQRNKQTGGKSTKKKTKSARGFGALTFASGGEVPVRISNGEMVVTDPKEVAANSGALKKINKLAAGGFASGYVAQGPGTGTSDSIYTTLPAGAFVVNAKSTKKFLGRAAGGSIPRFVGGGKTGGGTTSGGEIAGAGVGLIFALQSLTASLGEGSETLSLFINSIATAAFAIQGLGLNFKDLGGIQKKLGNALGNIPGVASGAGDRLDIAKRFKLGGAGRIRAFGGVGGTAAAGAGAALAGAVIGKVIGDIAGKAIADSFFGKQEEIAGFKGSTTAEGARSRGALEGGISGLGAGAGAGAGLGFVLGGPIGAAIGAAIGGGAGAIIGATFGEQNAALEQAAFEAAKALQKSGENISKSLDDLEKEFTISGFTNLSKEISEQQVNFSNAVQKFENKFNNEVTLTSASLDLTRAIPGVDAAFAGIDSFFGTTLSAANEARANASKAFVEAAKLIKPEDVERVKAQVNNALDKFAEGFDTDELVSLSTDEFGDALQNAADAGNAFAKSILQSIDDIQLAELDQTIAGLDAAAQSGDRLAAAQRDLLIQARQEKSRNPNQTFTEAGRGITTQAAQQLFPQGLFESTDKYNSRISAIVNSAGAELRARDRAAEQLFAEAQQRAIVNKALKDTGEELQNIIKSLKSPFTDLAFQVQNASDSFDIFKANIDNIFAGQGGFQTRGIQAGAFQSDSAEAIAERERLFNALDNITPGGSAGARAAQRLADEGPEIVKGVLEQVRDEAGQEGAQLGPTELLNRLETAFGNAGFQLPAGITNILTDISRQGSEDSTVIPEQILENLISSDKLTQQFGEVFEAAAEGPEKFAEQLNKTIQLTEKRIALETDLLNKQRELAKTLTDLNIAAQERTNEILSSAGVQGATGTEVTDSIDRLNRRVVAIAGTSDSRELLSRRGAALGRQAELQQQIEENPALALNEDIKKERIALADEINKTSEALDVLSKDTTVFSEILKKANRIGQNINALESGIDDVINKVVTGDVAGVQQTAIEQGSIFNAIQGIANIPQAITALQALNNETNRALVDAATGIEGAGENLQQTLRRQLATRLEGSGTLAGQVVSNYLQAIANQTDKARALAELQEERSANQAQNLQDISDQNFEQTRILGELNQELGGDAFANAVTKFNDAVSAFVNATKDSNDNFPQQQSGIPAVGRANGGSIFKPRGTDTVPAMLTPGEFVVRKSAVDQYGTGMMEAINSGNAQVFAASGGRVGKGVLYRADGGGTDGDDLGDDKFLPLSKIQLGAKALASLPDDSLSGIFVGGAARRFDKLFGGVRVLRRGKYSGEVTDTINALTKDITAERDARQGERAQERNAIFQSLRQEVKDAADTSIYSDKSGPLTEAFGVPISRTPSGALAGLGGQRARDIANQAAKKRKDPVGGGRGNLLSGGLPANVFGTPSGGLSVDPAIQKALASLEELPEPDISSSGIFGFDERQAEQQAQQDLQRRIDQRKANLETVLASNRNKEREEQLALEGRFTAGLNSVLANVGVEQQDLLENPNQVFADRDAARAANEAAKIRVRELKAKALEKEERGKQLRQQKAAQTAATDTSSAVNAAAQKQETAAQKARRLRNQELEARRKLNREKRAEEDTYADARRQATGGLNQEGRRRLFEKDRADTRAKNRKKSDEARKFAAKAREARDLERANRLADLNSIEDPLERSARRRELDQERRSRNQARGLRSSLAFSSDGTSGFVSTTTEAPRDRGVEAQKIREDSVVAGFRAQFNRAILSGNYDAARNIAQRYFSSGDISPETASIIKSQIDSAASARRITVPLYNSGGKVSGNVPIMAQSGEFVMNRQAVQRNGIGSLTRMNQGLPTFHKGGPVGVAQYRQFGGKIGGGTSSGPQSSITVNGSDAAKELNNAIITGGETVKQSWQALFDTVSEGLNSALSQVSTIPNQINATIAPVQIEGVNSFTEALAAQLVPKIIEQIAPLINTNNNGGTTEQGAGV